MSRSSQVRVAVVDRHGLFAECLGVVLEARDYRYQPTPVPRAPSAAEGERLQRRLLAAHVHVALINADLGPHCDTGMLMRGLARAGVIVIAVTDSTDEARSGRCLASGARCVLSKEGPLAAMVSAVRRGSRHESLVDRAERDRLIQLHREEDAAVRRCRERLARLSSRESEILRHLMAGYAVQEIAARGFVSEATVRTQVKAILGKLELSSQLAAVAAARAGGWEALPLAA